MFSRIQSFICFCHIITICLTLKKEKKSNDYLKEQFDRHPYYFYLSGFLPEYYFTLYLYLRGKV